MDLDANAINKEAENYVLSHKTWSRLLRKFYIKICSEFHILQLSKNKLYTENEVKLYITNYCKEIFGDEPLPLMIEDWFNENKKL